MRPGSSATSKLSRPLAYTAFADERAGDQAKEVDNYRDAEPGKILHEMRYGELAHFMLIPHTPYYLGSTETNGPYLFIPQTLKALEESSPVPVSERNCKLDL